MLYIAHQFSGGFFVFVLFSSIDRKIWLESSINILYCIFAVVSIGNNVISLVQCTITKRFLPKSNNINCVCVCVETKFRNSDFVSSYRLVAFYYVLYISNVTFFWIRFISLSVVCICQLAGFLSIYWALTTFTHNSGRFFVVVILLIWKQTHSSSAFNLSAKLICHLSRIFSFFATVTKILWQLKKKWSFDHAKNGGIGHLDHFKHIVNLDAIVIEIPHWH